MALNAASAVAFNGATVSSTEQTMTDLGFTDAELSEADIAFITVDGADVRFTYDGTTPTGSVGHLLSNSDKWIVMGNDNIRNLQFIRADSTDAYVAVTLEGYS